MEGMGAEVVRMDAAREGWRMYGRSSMCVSGVSLVGVSLLSADMAVAVVRPEVISQRV